MKIHAVRNFLPLVGCLGLLTASSALPAVAQGYRPVVPGTGQKVEQVGDDFEDEEWNFIPNGAKSSEEIDKQERQPLGESANGRWYEGIKRGYPDVARRIATPKGGLEGSTGALWMQTLHSGVPGRLSYRQQQDDFIADVNYALGGPIPVAQSPSAVVRVFLPPVAKWENRTGTHFGFRIALKTRAMKRGRGLFGASRMEDETYWPGMFIDFQSKEREEDHDYAFFRVRANSYGGDYKSIAITQTGWWTLGLSVTPDGRVHYFASPGVDDLTAEDHIASEMPYSYRAEGFKTFFFNICSGDNGRVWSTPFIVDDPSVYVVRHSERTARRSE